MLKRRTFLRQLGALFVAACVVRCFGGNSSLPAEEALLQVTDNETFKSLGKVVRSQLGGVQLSKQEIVAQLLQEKQGLQVSVDELRGFFAQKISNDFASGAVESVDQWLLSKTEIKLALVAAL